MALYVTIDDLTQMWGEEFLLDHADPQGMGMPDEEYLSGLLKDGQDLVDSYIGSIYKTPLKNPPGSIKRAIAAIVKQWIVGTGNDEDVGEAAKNAQRYLCDLGSGRAVLNGAEMLGQATSSDSGLTVRSRPSLYAKEGPGYGW